MKITNWSQDMQRNIQEFEVWWLQEHVSAPADFPLEMGEGEWDEQYIAWSGARYND